MVKKDTPAISETEGLDELATVIAATRDALSDDIITRLASTFSESISLLDRLTRNEGLMYLVRELDKPANQKFLTSLADAISVTNKNIITASPPAKGGIIDTYKLVTKPSVQEAMQMVSLFIENFNKGMRDKKL